MFAHDRAIVFNVRVCSTKLLEYDKKFTLRQTAQIIGNMLDIIL